MNKVYPNSEYDIDEDDDDDECEGNEGFLVENEEDNEGGESGFFMPKYLEDHEDEDSEAITGFLDECNDDVLKERKIMEDKMSQKLLEQKQNLIKDFNLILHNEHYKHEESLKREVTKGKDYVKNLIEQHEQRESKLTKGITELFAKYKEKEERLKKMKEKIKEWKNKYHNTTSKLRKEQMQSKEFTLDIANKGGEFLGVSNDLIFGREWFEDDNTYDLTDLLESRKRNVGDTKLTTDGGMVGAIIQNLLNRFKVSQFKESKFYNRSMIFMSKLNLLSKDVKLIESRFGSLIGTYFRLFRTQVLINLLVGVIVGIGYILWIIFKFLDDKMNPLITFSLFSPKWEDTMVVPTFISFSAVDKLSRYNSVFKVIFFMMIFPGFFIFTLFLFVQIIIENKQKADYEIKAKDMQKKKILSLCLNLWDHRKMTKKDVVNLTYETLGDLNVLLHVKKIEQEIKKRKFSKRLFLLLRKVFGWTVLICVIFVSWVFLIALNVYQDFFANLVSSFFPSWISIELGPILIPLAITIINSISPKIILVISDFEKWDFEETKIIVIITRLWLLKIVTIGLLCYQYIEELLNLKNKSLIYADDCMMKKIGDQVFLLILMTFISEIAGFISIVLKFVFKKLKNKFLAYLKKRKLRKLKEKELEEKREKEKQELGEEFNFADDDDDKDDKKEDGENEEKGDEEDGENNDEEEKKGENEEDGEEEDDDIQDLEKMEENEEEEKGEDEEENDGEEKDKQDENDEEDDGDKEKDDSEDGDKSQKSSPKKDKKKDKDDEDETDLGHNSQSQEKEEFETYKKLIELLYFQVIIWVSLPFFPFSVTTGGIFSFILFKYQHFVLKHFQRKEKSPIAARDLGFYFILFYILSYSIPLVMYYITTSVFTMSTYCGFGVIQAPSNSTTLMFILKDLGNAWTNNIFIIVYDHFLTNPLLLYVFCGVVLVLFIGRSDRIKSLRSYSNVVSHRLKRETQSYEIKFEKDKSEIENLQSKVEKLNLYIKDLKGKK